MWRFGRLLPLAQSADRILGESVQCMKLTVLLMRPAFDEMVRFALLRIFRRTLLRQRGMPAVPR